MMLKGACRIHSVGRTLLSAAFEFLASNRFEVKGGGQACPPYTVVGSNDFDLFVYKFLAALAGYN